MAKLDGKVALITGAAAGLGEGISTAYAKYGAKLIMVDLSPEVEKTAEKLILELKDKLNIEDMLDHAAHGGDSEDLASGTDTASNTMQAEAVQALTALGYGSAESLRAVKKSSPECSSVEDILKEALKFLL